MNQATRSAGTTSGETAAVMKVLADRRDLPPRVRTLLEGILSACSSRLERAVVAALDNVETQLFKLAEQSRNNQQQQRCFEGLREIKRGRSDIAPRYMLALEDALARFDQRENVDDGAPQRRPAAAEKRELSLVATSELEESLALQEFAAKTEIRQSAALQALGYRFGVLAGAPAFDAESLPIGPLRLGAMLRHACACLSVAADHRVLLYRSFEHASANAIGEAYDTVNVYLIDQRVLAHLRVQSLRAKNPNEQDRSEAEPDAADNNEPNRTEPAPSWRGAAAQPATPARSMPSGDIVARSGGMPNWNPAPPTHSPPADERDSELFTTLRELLAGRRHALGVADAAAGSGYVPSGEDMQAVLGALQSKPIAPMMMGGKLVQRSVGHLKQDLLAQLRQLAPAGKAPQLATEDSDTIDLVGMLFDYIMKNVRPDGSTQSLMTKLQVPLLRVALRDKSFFTRRAHPARQLLNAIAETGSHWLDDSEGPADRALVDKMQIVVDRVTQEFDGNLGLMENMLGDLSQHMHTLARKAEVSERRHVEAARGREKLNLAREQAADAIRSRINAARPGKLVRTLLEQAWTDVLALALLREGENSASYKSRLDVADQLLAASTGRDGDGKPPLALRAEIESGLDQVGYHHDDIQAVVKRLFTPEAAAQEENPSSNTEIAIKLKSKVRLGGDGSAPMAATKAARTQRTLVADSAEGRMYERLKTLPFGTWFEFRTNQQGDKVRRKLAWFSTLTSRCLFVNQRGVRTEERSLEQLAHDIVSGQVAIVETEQDSLVDRAWKVIVTSLKQLVGNDPATVPA